MGSGAASMSSNDGDCSEPDLVPLLVIHFSKSYSECVCSIPTMSSSASMVRSTSPSNLVHPSWAGLTRVRTISKEKVTMCTPVQYRHRLSMITNSAVSSHNTKAIEIMEITKRATWIQ